MSIGAGGNDFHVGLLGITVLLFPPAPEFLILGAVALSVVVVVVAATTVAATASHIPAFVHQNFVGVIMILLEVVDDVVVLLLE